MWRRIDKIDGFDAPDLFRPQLDLLEAQAMGQVLDQAKGRNNTGRPYVLVRVRNTEEKGSDVNLATDLIMDTQVHSKCHTAIVVTNDSDFQYPISCVAQSPVNVILVNPFVGSRAERRELARSSTELARRHIAWLRTAQVPAPQYPHTIGH